MARPRGTSPEHGTQSTYTNWGCRCPLCKAANAEYSRNRRRERIEEMGSVVNTKPRTDDAYRRQFRIEHVKTQIRRLKLELDYLEGVQRLEQVERPTLFADSDALKASTEGVDSSMDERLRLAVKRSVGA